MALYYENRIPELQLINTDFNEDIEQLIDEAELSEGQRRRAMHTSADLSSYELRP